MTVGWVDPRSSLGESPTLQSIVELHKSDQPTSQNLTDYILNFIAYFWRFGSMNGARFKSF